MVLLLLVVVLPSGGQTFYAPKVSIVASDRQGDMEELSRELTTQLTTYIRDYMPPVSVSIRPKHPIPVSLRVQLVEQRATAVVAHIELEVSRPLYGSGGYTTLMHTVDHGVLLPTDLGLWHGRVAEWSAQPAPLLRLSALIIEATMLYYDSFAERGGTPFLHHLREQKQVYQSAIEATNALSQLEANTPLLRVTEWNTPSGRQIRELWYLYHRQVLDQSPGGIHREETLQGLLPLIAVLWQQRESPSVMALCARTKASELSLLLREQQSTEAQRISKWLGQYAGFGTGEENR